MAEASVVSGTIKDEGECDYGDRWMTRLTASAHRCSGERWRIWKSEMVGGGGFGDGCGDAVAAESVADNQMLAMALPFPSVGTTTKGWRSEPKNNDDGE